MSEQTTNRGRLSQKVAVVTGGATGIGRAIVARFAHEGARVAVLDINAVEGRDVAAAYGGRYFECDVAHAGLVAHTMQQVVECFGGLDILVNCAAHLGGYNSVATMPEAEWRSVLSVTLDGVYHCSKYGAQAMLQRGGGAIVHIASVEGMTGVAGHAAYVTGKSALLGLTKSMAIDFGRHNIRVNAISPGIIDSGRPDIKRYKENAAHIQWWRDMTVLDRLGRPDEVAAAALFLVSDESSYITGQNLAVDGGWTIGHPPLPGL
ncbi:MAG: SDR family oxidoreductase [Caldilineaceae bacterium]|nr:SDR family oxidoreductase [Caldilineaceae bacterium]